MRDLTELLRASLDAEEAYARAASQDGKRSSPEGHHWQWVCDCDTPTGLDPMLTETLECANDDSFRFSLRSVEQYPSSVGDLPSFAIHTAEEVRTAVAAHIIRNDPNSTVRRVAALRKILDLHEQAERDARNEEAAALWAVIEILAEERGITA